MTLHIRRWGNSAAVRIPAAALAAARIGVDDAVEVREEGGRIVIEPIRATAIDVDALIAAITPATLHGPIDFGGERGVERW